MPKLLIIGIIMIVMSMVMVFGVRTFVADDVKSEQLCLSFFLLLFGWGIALCLYSGKAINTIIMGTIIGAFFTVLVGIQWKSMIGKSDEEIRKEVQQAPELRAFKVMAYENEPGGVRVFLMTLEGVNGGVRTGKVCILTNPGRFVKGQFYIISLLAIAERTGNSEMIFDSENYVDITGINEDEIKLAEGIQKKMAQTIFLSAGGGLH